MQEIKLNINPANLFEQYEIPKDLTLPAAYPIDCLGPVLGAAAMEIAIMVQIPPEIAGLSVLAVAALSVQKFGQVSIDGRTVALCLFILSILSSGERKSTADSLACKAISDIEETLKESYEVSLQDYKIRLAVYKARKEKVARSNAEDEDKITQLKELDAPTRPLRPELISSSPTLPSLISVLKNGVGSHGVFADEAGLMFGGHALNSANELETISTFTKLYDGSKVNRMRMQEEECYTLDNCRLSVNLMAQPIVANSIWENELWMEQGFLARFLIAFPDSLAGTRFWQDLSQVAKGSLERFWSLTEGFINKLIEDECNDLVSLTLEASAKEIWVDCYNNIERELRVGGTFYNYKPLANRVPENMLRIAGILALFDDPETELIKEQHIRNAGILTFHHFSETIRMFELRRFNIVQERASILLKWFKEERSGRPVANSDIVQRGPNELRGKGAKGFKEVLEYLEAQGSIKRLQSGRVQYMGKPVKLAWEEVGN